MTSSPIPMPQFTATGLVLPSATDIQTGLWALFVQAFGSGLNQSYTTPQGQLVTGLTAAFQAANDLLAQFVAQTDPATSSGFMQDGIGRLSFLERSAATYTVVTATCTGAGGTVIPAGSLAQAADGTIYQSTTTLTIPTGGTISGQFQALTTGPITCPAGSLTTIYRSVPGWDAVSNPADGTPGMAVQSPAAFEAQREASVALNAVGVLPAVRAAVLNVPGVVDAYVTENDTSSGETIGGVTVAANSIYVSVYGGASADIAQAIWSKKAPGCAYNGTTTVTVSDTESGYTPPVPTYAVSFTEAAALPIFIAVTCAASSSVPSDAAAQIQAAIVSAFSGGDGGPAARIGATLYALRFVGPITALGTWAQVVSITIGTAASPTAADVTATIAQMPTIAASDIAVTFS